MYLELPCRFLKELTNDELDTIELMLDEMSVTKSYFDRDVERMKLVDELSTYEYADTTVDLNNFLSCNPADEGSHITIRYTNGSSFVYKANYNVFKHIFQSITGKLIISYKDFENGIKTK